MLSKQEHYLVTIWHNKRIERLYACFVNPEAIIGRGVYFPHPTGIVIGKGVKIGENCTIYQHVTIGGKQIGDVETGNYPIICSNVITYDGAKILGNVSIGSGAVIGANGVILDDVENNSVYAGVPAINIKE